MAMFSTWHTSIQLAVYLARSFEPSRVPSSWMVMAPLHGPVKLSGPTRYSPLGMRIVALPLAAHADVHASCSA
jgi:hypothetical protein